MKKLVYIFSAIATILIVSLLSSCESQRPANKTAWLKKKGYLNADTFYIKDTVKGFDTTVIRQFDSITLVDTLTVVKDGIRVKTIVRWKDRIIEQTLTKRDTVVVRQQIRTVVTQIKKSKWYDNFILGFCCGLSLVLVIFGLTFRK